MGNVLGQVVGTVVDYSHNRRVQYYLENATQGSVLSAFHDCFAFEIRTFGLTKLRDLFEKYFVFDRSGYGKYWTIQSLRGLLLDRLKDDVATEACLPVLWRCLHFYGWHPFQRHNEGNGRLDRAGFERAVCSLTSLDSSLLSQDRNSILIHRDTLAHWRVFRSLSVGLPDGFFGVPDADKERMRQTAACELLDIHDILVKGEPNDVCHVPASGDEVMPVVARLAGPPPEPCELGVPKGDLLAILQLFQRVQPGARWHGRHNRSTFISDGLRKWRPEGPDNSALQSILGEKREYVDWLTFQKVIETLPDFDYEFTHMWIAMIEPTGSIQNNQYGFFA